MKTTHIYTYFPSKFGGMERVWVKSVSHSIPRHENCIEDTIKYHSVFGQVDVTTTGEE